MSQPHSTSEPTVGRFATRARLAQVACLCAALAAGFVLGRWHAQLDDTAPSPGAFDVETEQREVERFTPAMPFATQADGVLDRLADHVAALQRERRDLAKQVEQAELAHRLLVQRGEPDDSPRIRRLIARREHISQQRDAITARLEEAQTLELRLHLAQFRHADRPTLTPEPNEALRAARRMLLDLEVRHDPPPHVPDEDWAQRELDVKKPAPDAPGSRDAPARW